MNEITDNIRNNVNDVLIEDDYFSVMDKYFSEKGPVYHQFESYEYMINYLIQKIVDEIPSINFETKSIKYKATYGEVYIENAGFVDETHTFKNITPQEARLRDLTYESPVFVDITEEFWEYDEKKEKFNKTDEIFHKKVFLMKIPTMVRSSKCNLYGLSMDECISKGECSNDPGGYFIVNGKERVLVCQERLNYNQVYVFYSNDEKTPYTAEIRSMSEETGHSVLIQSKMNKDYKNITLSLPYMSKEVFAGSVFKALGFNSKDIMKFINPSTKEENKIVERIIRESIQYRNKEESMKYISKASMHKVEDDDERRLIYTQQVIENELFPHMGICSPLEKALFLGDMINKLIRSCLGIRQEDDRDNVSLKRIEGPGVLISDLFRMCMKRYSDNLKKYIEKRQDIITAMNRTNNITSSLKHAFSTGNWTIQKNGYMRTGVSQIMSRLTYPATISHLRRVIIPIGKEGKNVKIRQIHPTQCFFIDIIESPEGKSIGIVKNLSLLANITTGCNPILVREIVEKCDNFFPINDNFFEKDNYNMYKIYINGAMIGLTSNPKDFYDELLHYRKSCMFSNQVSFYYDDDDREVRIFCDHGRFIRPVLTVDNNKLSLKKEHLHMNWSELLENDIVRYIDSNEVEFSLIAMKPEDLLTYNQSVYNYCEIHPSAMLGVCSSVIPYPEHNQSPRLVYQSSMVKQALGVYSLAFKERFDTVVHVMHYPQKPLVSTKFDKMLKYDEMLTGCNPVVAILTYGGWNQEDSLMLNKSSVDRGMFAHTCYKTLQCEENKKTNCSFERIEVPPTKSHNNTMNYSKLGENGIIKKGTPVVKGDIIIGKTLTKVKTDEEDDKTDCSLAIGNGEEGIIDGVWEGINDEGNKMVKIRIRQLRIPEVGDKLASRSSQKGVCGLLLNQEDMPFTSQGITPDLLINPHCMPFVRRACGLVISCKCV
jgi:DNA-directed RNA polymerase II subunit RPB2